MACNLIHFLATSFYYLTIQQVPANGRARSENLEEIVSRQHGRSEGSDYQPGVAESIRRRR
jgi:hypothetical protein